MTLGILRGVLAGAAGTTALNAATYLDMAVRGRPASTAPADLVKTATDRIGVRVPGTGDERDNRLQGLAPLSGTAVGVTVGAVAGALHRALISRGHRLPAPIAIVGIAVAAMALSDVPLTVTGISDPSDWSAKDWASDAIPHLLYGATTYAVLRVSEV